MEVTFGTYLETFDHYDEGRQNLHVLSCINTEKHAMFHSVQSQIIQIVLNISNLIMTY